MDGGSKESLKMCKSVHEFLVVSVNTSQNKGTPKTPVKSIQITGGGVVGDAHHGTIEKEVSILDRDIVAEFAKTNILDTIPCGAMGENITISAGGRFNPQVDDEIRVGKTVLTVTQIGKKCHGDGCAIFRNIGKCVMPSEGIFCLVREGGTITPGMHGISVNSPKEH